MKTTLAGAVSRKVTVVPRRLLGPRVEKRRREARTLPVAADELLLPVADPDEPTLCPELPPEPWCPGTPGGWGSSGAGVVGVNSSTGAGVYGENLAVRTPRWMAIVDGALTHQPPIGSVGGHDVDAVCVVLARLEGDVRAVWTP